MFLIEATGVCSASLLYDPTTYRDGDFLRARVSEVHQVGFDGNGVSPRLDVGRQQHAAFGLAHLKDGERTQDIRIYAYERACLQNDNVVNWVRRDLSSIWLTNDKSKN